LKSVAVNNISNLINSRIRLTGISSGLDTDAIIEQLMSVERAKVDKIKQEKQILEWKRDIYRDIINKLRSITDEYFNVLKPKTNFTSQSAFTSFKISSSNESVVTVRNRQCIGGFQGSQHNGALPCVCGKDCGYLRIG